MAHFFLIFFLHHYMDIIFFYSPFLSLVNGHWSLADGKNPWLTGSYE